MEFDSFEQALKMCLEEKEGSERQLSAMLYCLEHAPKELREMLQQRHDAFKAAQHDEGCGCGCH